jgi:hypothetical protein
MKKENLTMTDYDYDYSKCTDARTPENYIGSEQEFTKDDLISMIDKCITDAENADLKNVKVVISANLDYDDYPYAYMCGVGKRKLTDDEIEKYERQEKIQKLATELAVTFYDASVALRLHESGKIKLV